ncbi:MAG: DNA-directed RNA polymerase subunit beta [candidate division TM6 bacterium GW2011_GWF2_37_49]|nr:MAG: DNA-directed RNA polymerase subunit beta [candidate division TM6 bacterium GW2011_GWF2_37_49]
MSQYGRGKGLFRKSFSKIEEVVYLPNLIEVQSKSFNDFAQLDCLPSERKNIGLEKVFRDTFPIEHDNRISLEYVNYELGDWSCICGQLTGIENRYKWQCKSCKKNGVGLLQNTNKCSFCNKDAAVYIHCKKCFSRVTIKIGSPVDECRYSGKTYTLPLKVKMQLLTWDVDPETSKKIVRDIKEQDVYFCDLPVMVDLYEDQENIFKLGSQGTFLINGVDRVVVSQIHRAPGVVFTTSRKNKDFRGQPYQLARVIPARGSWIDIEFDHNDLIYVRIDKKKKILVTTFLQALGFDRNTILSKFYDFEEIDVKSGKFFKAVNDHLIGQRLEADSLPKDLEKKFSVGQRITKQVIDKLFKSGVKNLSIRKSTLINKVVAKDVIDKSTGEILLSQGSFITEELLDSIFIGVKSFEVIKSYGYVVQPTMALTLLHDNITTREDALKEAYNKLKPGDIPTLKIMEEYISNLFYNSRFYDLTIVGRARINRKLGLAIDSSITYLTEEDIIATLKYLIGLRERGEGEIDDIDHLGNRGIRLVGELLQSQMYVGFARIERIVKERFRLQENYAAMMPYDFLNVKPLAAVLREFFGTGQLSQFMDQTNPLAEMAHKRRLSALGPGGITRERATFEVRDVHPSHYGRICPIETPEGQNIGLISSLSTYARVNDLGFIETPYRPVLDGVVQNQVLYLDAFQELGETIAQSTVKLNNKNQMSETKVFARKNGNIITVNKENVSFIDASPRLLFSVPTAMIPFLEHDDANRALMGSNMQRQAVPLVKCMAPLIGTGMEIEVGALEGAVIKSRSSGVVDYVSADKIIIRVDFKTINSSDLVTRPVEIYTLKKFGRSSHNTWIDYKPIVKVGETVNKGDVIASGAATYNAELALGNDVLVAFMPWQGYNFEDAIVISKKMVADDVFTSVHVEEFIVEARETKLGAEEITRDIPNLSEKTLEALDDDGVVRIGTRVKPGDILVGKVTLKGDVQVSPEEKLLRAIFGEKSREVRDTSLRVPPGVEGTVIDVKVFSRSGIRKDKRYKEIVQSETLRIEDNFAHHVGVLRVGIKEKLIEMLSGVSIINGSKKEILKSFQLNNMDVDQLFDLIVQDKEINVDLNTLKEMYSNQQHVLAALKIDKINQLRKGDELPSGVIKMIKVYVANKRHVSVGDKMAGRHGNKGVVSCIVNPEDMPYLADGTPVDIVLNPLGVPGRMNVGQILETVLGFVGKKIGKNLSEEINDLAFVDIKSRMIEYYGKNLIEDLEKADGKDGIYELAQNTAKNGVAMKTPIFAGADYESEIKPLLKSLGMSESGAYQLFDGRTGAAFMQPVMVGSIYMMKLNHLADDKLHARSVGPYSLITQQPLGGKAQFGGQRLGEMEVWALYAYGAAYTLQEMLTLKSDDINGRIKTYEAVVRGEAVPEPGIPESFNVFVKELQSLGLQVDLLKLSKEQIGE